MTDYTTDELFAILLARDFRPGDRTIHVGANMPMARAAAVLASLTTHPDARVFIGFAIENLSGGRAAPPVNEFLFDPRTLAYGEAYMTQQYVFDDMSRPDVFFVGGLQVDRRANVNLLGIGSADGGFRMRGPGAVALATMSSYCDGYYIVMPRHDARTFVERVDFITALGDLRERARLRLPGGGPRMILSPLGCFVLDAAGEMVVQSLHEGVTREQLSEATGFELPIPAEIPRTEPPSAAELESLRTRVDPGGLLRGR